MSPLEAKLDLILRGQHILMRANFSPNDPQAQAKHFVRLQNDITGWFNDYPQIVAGNIDTSAEKPNPYRDDRD